MGFACGVNNIPKYDPYERTIDCTDDADTCDVMLVVESSTSMTYYNISKKFRETQGYRASFNSTGYVVPLIPQDDDVSNFLPPIQTDGHFRSIITINAQMPGPTIVAHYNQTLNISVFNEMRNGEGIAIHWHGIHQIGTPEADGVSHITQNPIIPHNSYTYAFQATPAGTHWYHAHSGLQRTDGLYGALIIKDILPGNVYDNDYPEQHTLLLMDWQRMDSLDTFHSINPSLGYFKEIPIENPPYIQYIPLDFLAYGPDTLAVSAIPFWSGIINDRGRFFDELGRPNIANPNCNNLNCFNVSYDGRYRFRLIGAQAVFALRFSIEGHSLTAVASDGSPINSIEDVDYVIVNPGERYDIVVYANNTEQRNFWIWAETIEDEANSINQVFNNPISKHRAEAILHYNECNTTDIAEINETKTCTPFSNCKAVNCPFELYGNIIDCINVLQFESPSSISIPQSIHSPDITLFYSFGFDGDISSIASPSIDGINFRFPANPPLNEFKEFQQSNNMCPNRGCDHDIEPRCACTQVIDISDLARGSVIELVITNRRVVNTSRLGIAHPIHLHGHYFYVVTTGYGELDANGTYIAASDDIECIVRPDNQTCPNNFITIQEENGELKQELRWRDLIPPESLDTQNRRLPRKDTMIVPFGGYAVMRFIVDNPGWWMVHCHIQLDQTVGMAAVIRELPNDLITPNHSTCMPTRSSSPLKDFN